MTDKRKKNVAWEVADETGKVATWDCVQVAVLMDIRDELQRLNRLLHCSNFTDIPMILRRVEKNTTKRKPKK